MASKSKAGVVQSPGATPGMKSTGTSVTVVVQERFEETHDSVMGADICFLLDVSGSMSGAPAQAMAAELEWFIFDSEMVLKEDTVEIVSFNHTTQKLLKPTFFPKLERANIQGLQIAKQGSGGTALWTAMDSVLDARKDFLEQKREKEKEAERKPQKKKAFVLLVLTDGASGDSPEHIKKRLHTIGREIPHFHMHILGIHLDANTMSVLEDVKAANPKRCEVTNVSGGHAGGAIQSSFRTHFTKTVTHVRTMERKLEVDHHGVVHDGGVKVKGGANSLPAVDVDRITHLLGATLTSRSVTEGSPRSHHRLLHAPHSPASGRTARTPPHSPASGRSARFPKPSTWCGLAFAARLKFSCHQSPLGWPQGAVHPGVGV